MAIYTRGGDKGKTALFNGKRVFKSDLRVESYGTIDELNSVLGVVIASLPVVVQEKIGVFLQNLQHDLLDIGSALAFPASPPVAMLQQRVDEMEIMIDAMTGQMPELKSFILPGGSVSSANLHIARTTARRAERRIVQLMQKEEIDEQIVKYINRLSDLFFTMARYTNFLEKKKEIIWKKK